MLLIYYRGDAPANTNALFTLTFIIREENMRQRINQRTILALWKSWPMLLAALAVFLMVTIATIPGQVQAAGKITELSLNQNQFTPTSPMIKGTAKVEGAEKGQKVTADLIYVTQNLKALTVTKDVPESGLLTFDFSFSKPTNNWPQGDYKVVISTSDGAVKEIPLTVK
jgi:hypothetical protein